MKCVICKSGETRKGQITVTLYRGVVHHHHKGRTGQVCENYGEYYLSEEVSTQVMAMGKMPSNRMQK